MNVQIVATKTCSHYPNLTRELDDLGIGHDVIFIEDRPELAQRYTIRHSPNLVVDGRIVCRGQPSGRQLRDLLNLGGD